jgi:hypothetical protein
VPVVRAGDSLIVGFDERRLAEVLGLSIAAPPEGTEWLATKYEQLFTVLGRAVEEIGQARIDVPFAERRMTLRAHVLHIPSFAEGGWLTHRRGRFNGDDMQATTERCEAIRTVEEICAYVENVRTEIASYLRSAAPDDLERIVSSHYGGEVPVIEVMQIMLRHSAYHLRQLDWFMRSRLHLDAVDGFDAGLTDITVPGALFAT